MSTGFIVYIVIQFIASVALIYGYMHEKEVIAFEDKLWAKIKCSFRKKKPQKEVKTKELEEADLSLVKDPVYSPYSCFNYVA